MWDKMSRVKSMIIIIVEGMEIELKLSVDWSW